MVDVLGGVVRMSYDVMRGSCFPPRNPSEVAVVVKRNSGVRRTEVEWDEEDSAAFSGGCETRYHARKKTIDRGNEPGRHNN